MPGRDIQELLNSIFDPVNNALKVSSSGTSVSDTSYDATSWNGVTDVAPSKNAVRDKFESLAPGAATVISRTVVGAGGAANVDLTAIPATYENLEVMIIARDDAAITNHTLLVRLNNDSGANYNWQRMGSFDGNNGNNAEGVGQTSATVGEVTGSTAPAGAATTTRLMLPGYARTVFNKTILSLSGGRYGAASSLIYQFVSEWASTAAVNRITITPLSGSFIEGTVVTLYGISGS